MSFNCAVAITKQIRDVIITRKLRQHIPALNLKTIDSFIATYLLLIYCLSQADVIIYNPAHLYFTKIVKNLMTTINVCNLVFYL